MADNPIYTAVVDGEDVPKDDFREAFGQLVMVFDSVAAVRGTDTRGQKSVSIAGEIWAYDSTDTTSADDGIDCIIDFSGVRRFKRKSASLFRTRAHVAATDLSALASGTIIHVLGHTTQGIGAADYIKLGSAPSPVELWHVQSDDGSYWDIVGNTISFEQLGGAGDNSTNNTATFDAIAAGRWTELVLYSGKIYRVRNATIAAASALRRIHCPDGRATIRLIATSSGDVAISDQKPQYIDYENITFDSTGTKADGLSTIGLSHAASQSYKRFSSVWFSGFSDAGQNVLQCVNFTFNHQCRWVGCTHGLSLLSSGGFPCSQVTIEEPTVTSCDAGIYSVSTAGLTIVMPVFEYSGYTSGGTKKGALHIVGGQAILIGGYSEGNERNIYQSDALLTRYGGDYFIAATSADELIWSGLGDADRGSTKISNNIINTRTIEAAFGYDLNVGDDIVVKVADQKARLGSQMEFIRVQGGLGASATWVTILALSNQTGGGESRKCYRYQVTAGRADLTTGFDAGHIFNGTIYSATGSIPAWLRVSGTDLQMNITGSSYGLDYVLTATVSDVGGFI